MKYLIAAAAALSVLGGTAAIAQPYGDGGQAYDDRQPYYGHQVHRDQGYNRGYAAPAPYGYAQPYLGNRNAYGDSAYYGGNHGARAYSYNDRYDRHIRRESRRDRHYVAPRPRYDRHH